MGVKTFSVIRVTQKVWLEKKIYLQTFYCYHHPNSNISLYLTLLYSISIYFDETSVKFGLDFYLKWLEYNLKWT